MSGLLSWSSHVHGIVLYLPIAALVSAEAAIFVGFVFPGETAVVLGGVLASQHRLDLPILLAVVVAAAIAGDNVGYQVGRRFGPRLLDLRPLRSRRARLDRARSLVRPAAGLACSPAGSSRSCAPSPPHWLG